MPHKKKLPQPPKGPPPPRRKPMKPSDDFMCPITQELMVDPVFTEDGQTYERDAIKTWL